MAGTAYTVAAGKIGKYAKTLTANSVDSVTFGDLLAAVEIVTDGTAAVYVRLDGTDPAGADDATIEIPASTGKVVRTIKITVDGVTVVKLISSGTPLYSVAKVTSP